MTRRKTKAIAKRDSESRLAAAAWRLLASRPWRQVTIASVARSAKLPWDEVLDVAPSRAELIAILLRQATRDAARRYRSDGNLESARERLFDVVVSWFEAQQPRKKAMRNLYRDLVREPLTLVALRGHIIRLSEGLLALAEVDTGLSPTLGAAGLAAIIARAIAVWLKDDSEMGRTMAQIDRDLRRLEWLL